MKRASNSYRLQMIKEVAVSQERRQSLDPMVVRIQSLLDNQNKESEPQTEFRSFAGVHYDERAGGYVSNDWYDSQSK